MIESNNIRAHARPLVRPRYFCILRAGGPLKFLLSCPFDKSSVVSCFFFLLPPLSFLFSSFPFFSFNYRRIVQRIPLWGALEMTTLLSSRRLRRREIGTLGPSSTGPDSVLAAKYKLTREALRTATFSNGLRRPVTIHF